jgi:hypothetical protein
MHEYTHWLKIHGMVPTRNESRQYAEIQSYLDRNPDAAATLYLYEASLYDRAVELRCGQAWENLELNANSGFHSLTRLSRRPDSLCDPQPFTIPERLLNVQRHSTPGRGAR